jgi:hypothetical protein
VATRQILDNPRVPANLRRMRNTITIMAALMIPCALRAQAMAPLQQYYHSGRGDNYVAATAEGRQVAVRAGYATVRVEGCVLTAAEPGSVPLFQFWSAARGDNIATTTNMAAKGQSAGGYVLVRTEGYVYPDARKGTVPLNLYYHTRRHDNLTTATAAGSDSALRAGYTLVGIIGYVPPAGSCQ